MNVIRRIESLRAREHEATVELIAALVECDSRGAHLDLGYGSIWDFLVSHLKYSNAAASRRYMAMKCARRDTRVIGMLRRHEVTLSSLAAVEKEASKSPEVMEEIKNRSQRQVEEILARRNPAARKKRECVRREAVRIPKEPASTDLFSESSSAAEVGPTESTPPDSSAAEVEERVRISFSVSAATYENFERAKAMLSRKLPEGVTLETAFEEFLAFYLKHKAPKKRKKAKASSRSRHIPVAVRDEVFRRDEGRCTFVGAEGHRCGSQHDLEVDHIRPYALGGRHEIENLRLLCARHNRHRAEATFGRVRASGSLPQRNLHPEPDRETVG